MFLLLVSFLASAILCGVGLYILANLLPKSFLAAGFNARSNHSIAARQIGGLAVIPGILTSLLMFGTDLGLTIELVLCLSGASLLLWVVGALDDRFDLSVSIRFGSQLLAAGLVIYGLGPDFRLLAEIFPHWLEITFMVITLVAAINITNFMDGLDWMTCVGIGIPMAGLALLTIFQLSGLDSGTLGAIIAGALCGFAIFNRPPANIFLGDSGSFPLGLITGTALLLLAKGTHISVALILPLYYILDTVTTMVLRAAHGENILKAHSKHAYQLAKRSGWSVTKIVGHVAVMNLILIACATAILEFNHMLSQMIFLLVAFVLVLLLLLDFRGHFRKL
ncbi:glycosyltransferase family 4 protein [Ochrobactrum sp. Marseille-Q0166]|uniref:MraY family glycosyltransferase n=1 Tax=Ochrobactrum sp. Marseille-Q0166 TaxID=2761105 RepID=UPI00165627E0|nr:glycosyltransferase family 4 protein [Ochrobactrum sp. Marseille-Q0166]MBC8718498.1 glycosyltransferase family 4 protein [Ochrobactrum sp. Marseille-Q0166]